MNLENERNELKISFKDFKERILEDYRLAVLSRECSLLGRREVFRVKENLEYLEMVKNCPNWQ